MNRATPPEALHVSAPDSVVAGQPFSVTIEARTAAGARQTEYAGSVTLSASAGSITPAQVQLTAGAATVQATLTGASGDVIVGARVGTVSGEAGVLVLSGAAAVQLVIEPSAVLLTGSGSEQQLRVRALDAQGRPTTAVGVTWTSNTPAVASVSAGGLLTAAGDLGATQVTAQAGPLTSAPVLAVVAVPASGALLVADSQVVGDIVPVDPAAPYAPGWQYRVRLRDAAPTTGQIVLASGGAPVGGRVVSTAAAGAGLVDVVLSLVPLAEMFDQLELEQRISLRHAAVAQSAEARRAFDIQGGQGAALLLRRRPAAPWSAVAAPSTGIGASAWERTYDVGPFECTVKAEVELPSFPLTLHQTTFSIDPDLDFDIGVTGRRVRRAVLTGGLASQLDVGWEFTAAIDASASCEVTPVELVIPIGGPIALFIGGRIPLGVAFTAEPKITLGDIGYDAYAAASVTTSFGLDCTGACELVTEASSQAEGYFRPRFPTFGNDFRADLTAGAYAKAGLSLGSILSRTLRYEAVEMRAGLQLVGSMAGAQAQANDPAYASDFVLRPHVKVGASTELERLAELLGEDIANFVWEPELTPLARTPQGVLAISPSSVRAARDDAPGDTATFRVSLEPIRFLGDYAIDSVQIFRRVTSPVNASVTLERAPGACGSIGASGEQEIFTCRTVFPDSLAGDQTFYAFVRPKIFGVAVPLSLELAEDAPASLRVDTGQVAIRIEPAEATVTSGQALQFTAAITGTSNTEVSWAAVRGSITGTGLYTAPATAGPDTVIVRAVANPQMTDTALVTVVGSAEAHVRYTYAELRTSATATGGDACNRESYSTIGGDTILASYDEPLDCVANGTNDQGNPLLGEGHASSTFAGSLGGAHLQWTGTQAGEARASGARQDAIGSAGGNGAGNLWIEFEISGGSMQYVISGSLSGDSEVGSWSTAHGSSGHAHAWLYDYNSGTNLQSASAGYFRGTAYGPTSVPLEWSGVLLPGRYRLTLQAGASASAIYFSTAGAASDHGTANATATLTLSPAG